MSSGELTGGPLIGASADRPYASKSSNGPHAKRRTGRTRRGALRRTRSVSPRRKAGSIHAGLWNMGPGFRRGDSRGWRVPPNLSDGPHVQRGIDRIGLLLGASGARPATVIPGPLSAVSAPWASAARPYASKSSDLPSPAEPTPPKRLRRPEAGFAKAGGPHAKRRLPAGLSLRAAVVARGPARCLGGCGRYCVLEHGEPVAHFFQALPIPRSFHPEPPNAGANFLRPWIILVRHSRDNTEGPKRFPR